MDSRTRAIRRKTVESGYAACKGDAAGAVAGKNGAGFKHFVDRVRLPDLAFVEHSPDIRTMSSVSAWYSSC